MKLKIGFIENIEIETDDPALTDLETLIKGNYFITKEIEKEAIAAIEKITGMPFGDEEAKRTIIDVCDEDGNTLLTWW